MKKLEKLKAENKKVKAKDKKAKHTPPQAKIATPHSKGKSPTKGGRERKRAIRILITLCLSIIITSQALPLMHPYPLAKLPVSMG
jgi:hypothetical protein